MCSEVNYLPNFPQGEDEASHETIRQEITLEVEKTEQILVLFTRKC